MAVHDATAAAREFSATAALDEGEVSRLAIVVEELLTNLYDHGGLSGQDVFEIELSATEAEISLVLIDPGMAFDPRLSPGDDASPSRGGGAGQKLVRAWASRIGYETTDSRNRLSVLLPRKKRGS